MVCLDLQGLGPSSPKSWWGVGGRETAETHRPAHESLSEETFALHGVSSI